MHAHKSIPHLWNKQQAEDDCYGKKDASRQHPVAGLGLLGEQDANGDQRDAGQDRAVHGQRNEAGIVEGLNVDFACLKCEEEPHPQVDGLIDEEDGKHNVIAVRRACEDHVARQLQIRKYGALQSRNMQELLRSSLLHIGPYTYI